MTSLTRATLSYSVHAPFTAGGGIFGGTPDSGAGAPADPGFSPSGAEGTSGCIMVPALSSAGATRRLRAGFQQHLSTQQRPLLATRPKRSAQTHLVRVRVRTSARVRARVRVWVRVRVSEPESLTPPLTQAHGKPLTLTRTLTRVRAHRKPSPKSEVAASSILSKASHMFSKEARSAVAALG